MPLPSTFLNKYLYLITQKCVAKALRRIINKTKRTLSCKEYIQSNATKLVTELVDVFRMERSWFKTWQGKLIITMNFNIITQNIQSKLL